MQVRVIDSGIQWSALSQLIQQGTERGVVASFPGRGLRTDRSGRQGRSRRPWCYLKPRSLSVARGKACRCLGWRQHAVLLRARHRCLGRFVCRARSLFHPTTKFAHLCVRGKLLQQTKHGRPRFFNEAIVEVEVNLALALLVIKRLLLGLGGYVPGATRK